MELLIFSISIGAAGLILLLYSLRARSAPERRDIQPRATKPRSQGSGSPLPIMGERESEDDPEVTVMRRAPVRVVRSKTAGTEAQAEGANDPASGPEIDVVEINADLAEDDILVEEPTGRHALILVTALGETDRGLRRQRNEDSCLVLPNESLFVIADGMGGYAGGEMASNTAVEVIRKAFTTKKFDGEPNLRRPKRGDELVRAIRMANHAIFEKACSDPELTGMGTTIAATRFSPNRQRVYIAHVGDSRVYRLRGKELHQLTTDHTFGAATGATGAVGAQLTRAVGIGNTVKVDLSMDTPKASDHYMICSDGLTKMLKDDAIAAILGKDRDLDRAVHGLIAAANEKGGRDNITVILIRVDDARVQHSDPPKAM